MPTKLAKLRLGAVARRRAAFLLGLAAGLATASPAAAQAPDDPAQHTGGGAIGGRRLGTLDNGELRFAAYGPPKALDQPGAVN
jgi:hypothetical protein